MKTLTSYISESLFSKKTLVISDELLKKYNLIFNPKTNRYDCNTDIIVERDLVDDYHELLIPFGVIKGNFICIGKNFTLTSLKNFPQAVWGDFTCERHQLGNLKGVPTEVGRSFSCVQCELMSLKGCPEEIKGDFLCGGNLLDSLKFAPKTVGGEFKCNVSTLTSLKGCPKVINGDFNCMSNNLKSIKDGPEIVKGDFICDRNPAMIYDENHFYKYLPKIITGKLYADENCNYKLASTYYNTK